MTSTMLMADNYDLSILFVEVSGFIGYPNGHTVVPYNGYAEVTLYNPDGSYQKSTVKVTHGLFYHDFYGYKALSSNMANLTVQGYEFWKPIVNRKAYFDVRILHKQDDTTPDPT